MFDIRQRACWDIRPLLLTLGADTDDTLVIVFNVVDYTATGIVGDDDVVAQVAARLAEKSFSDALVCREKGEARNWNDAADGGVVGRLAVDAAGTPPMQTDDLQAEVIA